MSLLSDAEDLINNQRAQEYGDADVLLNIVAHLWEPIFGCKISAIKVIQAMAALKLGRTIVSPGHRDSWVDLAGYAGLSERVLIKDRGNGQDHKVSDSGT